MKKQFCILFLLMACLDTQAQDLSFTNSNQSLVYLNPSFAGSNGLVRAQAQYRYQGSTKPMPYAAAYLGVDAKLKPLPVSLAAIYTHNEELSGALETDAMAFVYAHHFSLPGFKLKIVPSLQLGYMQRRLNANPTSEDANGVIDFRTGEHWILGNLPSANKSNLDISSGLLFNYRNFYLGAALFHINRPNMGLEGDYAWPTRLTLHSSYNFKLDNNSMLQALARFDRQRDVDYMGLQVNAVLKRYLVVGTGYRWNTADPKDRWSLWNSGINLNAGFRCYFFNLGVGYDIIVDRGAGKLRSGPWELNLSINIRGKNLFRSLTGFEAW